MVVRGWCGEGGIWEGGELRPTDDYMETIHSPTAFARLMPWSLYHAHMCGLAESFFGRIRVARCAGLVMFNVLGEAEDSERRSFGAGSVPVVDPKGPLLSAQKVAQALDLRPAPTEYFGCAAQSCQREHGAQRGHPSGPRDISQTRAHAQTSRVVHRGLRLCVKYTSLYCVTATCPYDDHRQRWPYGYSGNSGEVHLAQLLRYGKVSADRAHFLARQRGANTSGERCKCMRRKRVERDLRGAE